MIKTLILRFRAEGIGLALGAASGWLYWFFIGCDSGTCAITSSALNSSVYGAIMGALLAGIVTDSKKTETKKHE